MLVLFILCALAFSFTLTSIVDDSVFDCTSLTITPLVDNAAAIDMVRAACAEVPICNERFATEFIYDIDTFTALLQFVSPFNSSMNLESPIQALVCDKMIAEVRDALWASSLVEALDKVFPCAPGERFTLIKHGKQGKCVPIVSNTLNSCESEHFLKLLAIPALFILLLASIITNIAQIRIKMKRD